MKDEGGVTLFRLSNENIVPPWVDLFAEPRNLIGSRPRLDHPGAGSTDAGRNLGTFIPSKC